MHSNALPAKLPHNIDVQNKNLVDAGILKDMSLTY